MRRPIWPVSPMILSVIWHWIGLRLYLGSNLFLHTWGLTLRSITIKLWFSRSPKVLKMIYFFNSSVVDALSRGSGLLLLHCISNCNAAVVHVNVETLLVSFTLQLGHYCLSSSSDAEGHSRRKSVGFSSVFPLKTSYTFLVHMLLFFYFDFWPSGVQEPDTPRLIIKYVPLLACIKNTFYMQAIIWYSLSLCCYFKKLQMPFCLQKNKNNNNILCIYPTYRLKFDTVVLNLNNK